MLKILNNLLMAEAGTDGVGSGAGAGSSSLLTSPANGGGAGATAGSGDSSQQASKAQGSGADSSGGNAQGGAASDWKASLPEELRDNPSIKAFSDVQGLVKSYVNAQKMIGADKLVLPGKHASEDDWKAVYTKLGLPESVDKYELAFKDEKVFDKDFSGKFKEVSFKAGILPKQAQAMADWLVSENAKAGEAMQAERIKAIDAQLEGLKTEWGTAYNQNLKQAQIVVSKFGDENLNKYLDETGLGSDANLIKFLAKIGSSFKEDIVIATGEQTHAMTPAEAKAKANSLMADMKGPYYDKNHINHKAAVKEVQDLFNMAYPKK